MSRRRLVVASATALMVAVGAASTTLAREGGPLADGNAYGYAVTVPVGGTVTDALHVLALQHVPRDAEITVMAIEQVFPDRALSSAGEWVAGPDRSHEAGVVQQFYLDAAPPKDPRLGTIGAVTGLTVRSQAVDGWGKQLLLAIKVTKPGHYLRDGFWVTYRYNGVTYRDRIRSEVTICTPDALESDGTCAFLGDD